jgi:hypothetical protein
VNDDGIGYGARRTRSPHATEKTVNAAFRARWLAFETPAFDDALGPAVALSRPQGRGDVCPIDTGCGTSQRRVSNTTLRA